MMKHPATFEEALEQVERNNRASEGFRGKAYLNEFLKAQVKLVHRESVRRHEKAE